MASNAGAIEVTSGSKHEEIPVSQMQPSDYVKTKPMEVRSETSLQSTMSSLNPGYGVLKILEWLTFVDGYIDKSSINIMTLGLYEITLREIESIRMDRVSDIYHLLADIMHSSEALTRFLYALEKLGRKRRGVYCVTHFDRIVGIARPSTHHYDIRVIEDKEFAFYQVLVKICIRLEEDRNTSKRVRTYACRHVVGSATLKTVADLFLKMLKTEDLTTDDQEQLASVLGILGANSCLEMLQSYRSTFKMDEIEWEQIQPKQRMQNIEPPSASNSTLNTISTDRSTPSERYPMESPTPGNTPTINGPPFATISGHHEGERTPLLLAHGPHHPAAHPAHHHHHHHRQPAQPGRSISWKLWAVFSGLLLLSLLLVGTGLTMISLAAVTESDIGGTVTLYKNTTAALANVQSFSTSRVILRQSPETGEVYIPIAFYKIEKSCDNLHSKDYDSPAENISISTPATFVNNYLLPDSTIDYTICAVTNSENYTQYHVDYFILEGLDEDFSFNTDSSDFAIHKVINITYDPDFQQPKNCFKPTLEYKVRKRSYYSVLISPPPPNEIPSNNLRIWYSKRNMLNVISLQEADMKCPNTTASYCTFNIGISEHKIGHFCLVAEVQDMSNDPYTHVEIDSSEWTPGKIMFYAFGGFSVLVGAVLATAVAIVIMKCRFQREADPTE